MSSPNALATVTASLQYLLADVATTVTTQPPSMARSGTTDQINIFLYGTYYNTAFSNSAMPGQTHSGESAHPPLPLVLKYLITAYGNTDDDISGQQVMGQAMSILHDHPLLGSADIVGITPDSGLQNQIERVRITPDTLSLDDMSKLWSSFQSAEYRLSVGYEVSVVLIESTRVTRTPLPVLKRGASDQGPMIVASSTPTLTSLHFPNQKPAAELGDSVTLLGTQLSSEHTLVRFEHAQLALPIDIQPEISSNPSELVVQLPNPNDDVELGSKWPAGFYKVSLLTQKPGIPAWRSNSVALPLAPTIESINPNNAVAGDVVLNIECHEQILGEQNAALLFSDRAINVDSMLTPADPSAPTTLTFTVEGVATRVTPYVVRLRVDGVDSIPVDFTGSTAEFDANQQVTIS